MNNMKNMIVLRDLPSNLIDEAFLILKPNQKIENFEHITKSSSQNISNSKDYIVKEAEMVISSFLSKNDNSSKKEIENLKRKNKNLKLLSVVSSVLMILVTVIKLFL